MLKHSIMMILISLVALCLIGVGLSSAAHAISLKEQSVVSGDTITLGDLFSGLRHNEGRVLGAAPRPGTEMILNARTLMRVAIAMDLPWRPGSSNDHVVLRRAATVIDRSTIEAAIKEDMAQNGMDGKFNLIIPNGMDELILPQNMPKMVEISDLNIRRDTGFFEAKLVAPSKDNPLKTLRVTGRIERMIEVPVLRAPLRNGDVIGERDIEMIDIREQDLQHSMLLSSAALIGMTPRRMLLEGKPVLDQDIESPVMVERGDLILMTFQQGPLVLSTRGKALQDGAQGESIRVVNLASNKTIEAQVTGTREVVVRSQ